MKFRLSLFVAVLPVLSLAAPPQTDIKQPQSPPLPKPDWVKIVDHGKYDPRLKGYLAPEGLKSKSLPRPTIINPVGAVFGLDGTHVLEWLPTLATVARTPVTFTYKDGTKRNVATMKKHEGRAKVLVERGKESLRQGRGDPRRRTVEHLLHDGWIYCPAENRTALNPPAGRPSTT